MDRIIYLLLLINDAATKHPHSPSDNHPDNHEDALSRRVVHECTATAMWGRRMTDTWSADAGMRPQRRPRRRAKPAVRSSISLANISTCGFLTSLCQSHLLTLILRPGPIINTVLRRSPRNVFTVFHQALKTVNL